MAEPEGLKEFLPEGAYNGVVSLLKGHPLKITIKKKRTSKLGDYRPPVNNRYHHITVNGDLNRYSFLLTLLHEIAHMKNWINNGRRVPPHGKEWKQTFSAISMPFIENGIFPPELTRSLSSYFRNPPATVFSNPVVSRLLSTYDNNGNAVLLETLPRESLFKINNGKTFKKLDKIRKNYRCYCLDNRKYYTVKPTAIVTPVGSSG